MRISDWSSDVCSSDLVASIDLSATLFGRKLALPVALGPVGIGGMYARRGELQAARAAGAAGIPTCLSTVSICSIEEVARAADPFWFQLYVIRDRAFMTDLVARAKAAGAQALRSEEHTSELQS